MPQALTDEQRQFAAENHNLIYKYLWDRRLEIDDYYDIAVFGYLRAVKRYLTEPWLHRYQFSTVAWHAMRQNIASFHRAEERRKETEQKYLKTLRTTPQTPLRSWKLNCFYMIWRLFPAKSSMPLHPCGCKATRLRKPPVSKA